MRKSFKRKEISLISMFLVHMKVHEPWSWGGGGGAGGNEVLKIIT